MALKTVNSSFDKIFAEFNDDENITKDSITALVFSLNKRIETLEANYAELLNKTSKTSILGNFASPSAKKLAEENGLKDSDFENGSGKNGKIVIRDIKEKIPNYKKTKKTVEKNTCKGTLKKSGDPCKRNGVTLADDGNWYCHSHITDYQFMKDGEISDSESEIESIADGDIIIGDNITDSFGDMKISETESDSE